MTSQPNSLEAMAEEFWRDTDLGVLFPRPIAQALPLALPASVAPLERVDLASIADWLARRGMDVPLPRAAGHGSGRIPRYADWMGCLIAHRGHGFIFVCATDSAEEQRFTLAHDAAHFLIDYLTPRRQVLAALGEGAADVLDGLRPATPAERTAAALSRLRLGPHLHLLPRAGDGGMAEGPASEGSHDGAYLRVEDRADELGLELVAARRRVEAILATLTAEQRGDPEAASEALAESFGLPQYFFARAVRRGRPRAASPFLSAVRAELGKGVEGRPR